MSRTRSGRFRPGPRVLALVAAAAVLATAGVVGTGAASRAEAAVPDTIPLTLTNNSGTGEQIHLYNLGTELSTGRQGWADADGTFHPWPGGTVPPVPAPDASFAGPADGESMTIRLPKFSGRLYFSYGEKLDFRLATGGLVQPAVQNPTDPNRDILFNWSEYTLNDSGLWLNSTQVDMFSAPYAVGVERPDGSVSTTGHLKPGGYQGFFDALEERGGGWEKLIHRRADGTVLRALAPSHGIEAGAPLQDSLKDYIDRVWQKYSTETLTVTPFSHRPDIKYYGRVSGDRMNFTDGSGALATSFAKPDSDSVYGCYKLLDAPNDMVRGPLSRTLCAALNRSTLLSNSQQPDSSSADFYRDAVTNHYAREVHERMADGKAYAFAFDDVGAHESLVHDGDPRHAYVTLDPLSGDSGPAPTPTGGASPSPGDPGPGDPAPSPTPTVTPTLPPTGDTFFLHSGGQLSTRAAAEASADTIPSADGTTHDGQPYEPLVYEAHDVVGDHDPTRATDFTFRTDAGTHVGLGQQVRVSYDLTGDGTFERVETFRYFATDPVPGYEEYLGSRAGLHSATGTLGDMSGGTIRVEVWNAIGDGTASLGVGSGSVLTTPF
ncbi:hypothetical protein BU52_10225 [Streptomyces toyocaensis]|uniref:GH64 domain-containing protein n=1 Tax=Streptomyces toyocaensis TaxID=55952 RepID=A0A081XUZ9_STRTO|nr:hypothetical protein BU52_10225 [Streptomyces toyocaensis]